MTREERETLLLAVTALRDVGETLTRLHEAMGRMLSNAGQILERAERLLNDESYDSNG